MTELAAALQAESAAERWRSIEKLTESGRLAVTDEATRSSLINALGDEHPFVRWQAGLALARQEAGWQALVELLKHKAKSQSETTPDSARSAAIDALATQKSTAANAILIELLHSGDALARQSAAEALAHQDNTEAVTPLLTALNDADPWVRRAAAYALGHIGDPSAVGLLIGKLGDPAVIVRRSAAYALGALRAGAAVPRLRGSLADQDPQVRRNAAWALGRIGQPEAVPDLEGLLNDPALAGTIAVTARQAIDTITKPRWLQLLLGLRWRFR